MTEQQQSQSHRYQYYITQLPKSNSKQHIHLKKQKFNVANKMIRPIMIDNPVRLLANLGIHNINILTNRQRKISPHLTNLQQACKSLDRKDIEELKEIPMSRSKRLQRSKEKYNLQKAIIRQQEQLQVLKKSLKFVREENEEYLKHNKTAVKKKIQNKLSKHRNQKDQLSSNSNKVVQLPKRQRITQYNHELQEYLIRSSLKKQENQKLNLDPEDSSARNELQGSQSNLKIEYQFMNSSCTCSKDGLKMTITPKHIKGIVNINDFTQTSNQNCKMMIVSRLNPLKNKIEKLKNFTEPSQTKNLVPGHFKIHSNRHLSLQVKPISKNNQSFSQINWLNSKLSIANKSKYNPHSPLNFIKLPIYKDTSKNRGESKIAPKMEIEQNYLNDCLKSKEQGNITEAEIQLSSLQNKLKNDSKLQKYYQKWKVPKKQVIYSRKNLNNQINIFFNEDEQKYQQIQRQIQN